MFSKFILCENVAGLDPLTFFRFANIKKYSGSGKYIFIWRKTPWVFPHKLWFLKKHEKVLAINQTCEKHKKQLLKKKSFYCRRRKVYFLKSPFLGIDFESFKSGVDKGNKNRIGKSSCRLSLMIWVILNGGVIAEHHILKVFYCLLNRDKLY